MDEMKRWAHTLADLNEQEFDLKKIVREGELLLSGLIQELGWAKEGKLGFRPDQAKEIAERIKWVEQHLVADRSKLNELGQRILIHSQNKPPQG